MQFEPGTIVIIKDDFNFYYDKKAKIEKAYTYADIDFYNLRILDSNIFTVVKDSLVYCAEAPVPLGAG